MLEAPKAEGRPPRTRSRVTNGVFAPSLDGRSSEERRMRDIQTALAADCGGADKLTESERVLISQAALLQVSSERAVDSATQVRTAALISRIMSQLADIRSRSINTALATAAE